VESTRASQRGIKCIGPVRSTYYYDFPPRLKTVHHRQQLGDNPLFHIARDFLPFRRYRIYFINEYYAWRIFLCLFKRLPEPLFTFAIKLTHYFGTSYRIKIGIRFVGDCFSEKSLACARRPVQQNTSRCLYSYPVKYFRMPHGKLYHLTDLLNFISEATYVFVVNSGNSLCSRFWIRSYHKFSIGVCYSGSIAWNDSGN